MLGYGHVAANFSFFLNPLLYPTRKIICLMALPVKEIDSTIDQRLAQSGRNITIDDIGPATQNNVKERLKACRYLERRTGIDKSPLLAPIVRNIVSNATERVAHNYSITLDLTTVDSTVAYFSTHMGPRRIELFFKKHNLFLVQLKLDGPDEQQLQPASEEDKFTKGPWVRWDVLVKAAPRTFHHCGTSIDSLNDLLHQAELRHSASANHDELQRQQVRHEAGFLETPSVTFCAGLTCGSQDCNFQTLPAKNMRLHCTTNHHALPVELCEANTLAAAALSLLPETNQSQSNQSSLLTYATWYYARKVAGTPTSSSGLGIYFDIALFTTFAKDYFSKSSLAASTRRTLSLLLSQLCKCFLALPTVRQQQLIPGTDELPTPSTAEGFSAMAKSYKRAAQKASSSQMVAKKREEGTPTVSQSAALFNGVILLALSVIATERVRPDGRLTQPSIFTLRDAGVCLFSVYGNSKVGPRAQDVCGVLHDSLKFETDGAIVTCAIEIEAESKTSAIYGNFTEDSVRCSVLPPYPSIPYQYYTSY